MKTIRQDKSCLAAKTALDRNHLFGYCRGRPCLRAEYEMISTVEEAASNAAALIRKLSPDGAKRAERLLQFLIAEEICR